MVVWAFSFSFLLLWEVVIRAFKVPPYQFPAPSAAFARLVGMAWAGELTEHLAATTQRVLYSVGLAAVPGVAIGLVLALIGPLRSLLSPYVAILYTVPKVAILPLVMIIIGPNEQALVVTACLSALAQIIVSTMVGVGSIEPVYLEAGRNYGAFGWRFYVKVLLPAALPPIWTGLRLGMGLALTMVVVIEFITAQNGLGHLVWRFWNQLVLEDMFAALVSVGVFGWLIANGLMKLGHLLMPWSHE